MFSISIPRVWSLRPLRDSMRTPITSANTPDVSHYSTDHPFDPSCVLSSFISGNDGSFSVMMEVVVVVATTMMMVVFVWWWRWWFQSVMMSVFIQCWCWFYPIMMMVVFMRWWWFGKLINMHIWSFFYSILCLTNAIVQPTNNHFDAMDWPCPAGFLPFRQSISDRLLFYSTTLHAILPFDWMVASSNPALFAL